MCSVHLTGEAVSKETPLAIYGASLETGESGILYHTIGNNGAFYSSYAAIPGFSEQVAALSPSLIVLSLGTNESFSTSLTRDELYKQINTVVSSLRKIVRKLKFTDYSGRMCTASGASRKQKT